METKIADRLLKIADILRFFGRDGLSNLLILLSVLMRLLAIEYSDDLDKTIMEMESAINIKEPENLFHDQGDLTC